MSGMCVSSYGFALKLERIPCSISASLVAKHPEFPRIALGFHFQKT